MKVRFYNGKYYKISNSGKLSHISKEKFLLSATDYQIKKIGNYERDKKPSYEIKRILQKAKKREKIDRKSFFNKLSAEKKKYFNKKTKQIKISDKPIKVRNKKKLISKHTYDNYLIKSNKKSKKYLSDKDYQDKLKKEYKKRVKEKGDINLISDREKRYKIQSSLRVNMSIITNKDINGNKIITPIIIILQGVIVENNIISFSDLANNINMDMHIINMSYSEVPTVQHGLNLFESVDFLRKVLVSNYGNMVWEVSNDLATYIVRHKVLKHKSRRYLLYDSKFLNPIMDL